jgi:two-component system NtrC family sensor kinase
MLVGAGFISVLFLLPARAGAQGHAQPTGSGADLPLLLLGLAAAVLLGCWLHYLASRRSRRTSEDESQALKLRLEMTQRQLIEREKLASLGQLTAGIAHEIKNPLNFVTNFSDLSRELLGELRTASTDGEREDILAALEQNLVKISEHGHRADDIVRGMMLHARGGDTGHETVDLNALISESVQLAYHSMRAQQDGFNCTIEFELEDSLAHPSIVRQDISQVLLNILQNAMQAVHQRQKAGDSGFIPTLRVRSATVGDRVAIHVRDNGPGIPEGLRRRIFEPFFTTKSAGTGTGLGLSIAHEIVTKGHGGTIRTEDAPGGGAEFIIELPVTIPAQV